MDANIVPQTALEKLYQKWDPVVYDLVTQFIPGVAAIVAGANAVGQTTPIQPSELSYIFGLRSQAVLTAGGTLPTVLYRIGFKSQSGSEDWTNGTAMAPLITGDKGSAMSAPPIWDTPRVVFPNEIVIATVDNNLPGAAGLTIDVGLVAVVVRKRREIPERVRGGY